MADQATDKDKVNQVKEPFLGKVIVRRNFTNPDGDWKKTEAAVKDINTLAEVAQGLLDDFMKADKLLREKIIEAYKIAPSVDCLLNDCPLSPTKQTLYVKMYLKKLGWDGVRDVFIDASKIEPFAKTIKDGGKWLLKFKSGENK